MYCYPDNQIPVCKVRPHMTWLSTQLFLYTFLLLLLLLLLL
jgi:hypothetical protein